MCKRWSSFLIFDEWNIKFIQSETLQGFSRLYEACMNTWVAVVDINQGPLSFCLLSTHLHSLVCVQILLILLLWSLLELTLRDHTEHRNGNICFLFTWAAENGCFLCTWAPAAFDKADTWVSWTIQLQNHYIIIAEKYDLRVNAKISPIMRCRSCLCRQTDPGLFVQPCGDVSNGTVVSTFSIHVDNSSCWRFIWLPIYPVDKRS